MNGGALLDRHQRFPQHPCAEVRHNDRHGWKTRCHGGECERIAEPQVER